MLYINKEPQAEVYTALLRFARAHCTRFSLVWRHRLKFDLSAQQIATGLEPWLIAEAEAISWPGTTTTGSNVAVVRQYKVTRQSIELLHVVEGLYSWLAPALPEDIAFYSHEGRCWLASVSHEGMAWFEDEKLPIEEVCKNVPGISIISR